MTETTYYQCHGCDAVVVGGPTYTHEHGHYEGRRCSHPDMRPVVVLPQAEAERLRELERRVKDDALASDAEKIMYGDKRYGDIAAYRAALKARMEGK